MVKTFDVELLLVTRFRDLIEMFGSFDFNNV